MALRLPIIPPMALFLMSTIFLSMSEKAPFNLFLGISINWLMALSVSSLPALVNLVAAMSIRPGAIPST